jgi:tol-pal system protein YbgF
VPAREPPGPFAALHTRQAQQTARIDELEARIALLEAEARQQRTHSDDESHARPAETVRIGATHEPARRVEAASDEAEPAPNPREARPQLRLYGRKQSSESAAPGLPPVPVVSETLPVAPLPSPSPTPNPGPRSAGSGRVATATAASDSEQLTDYVAGLRLLREHRYDEALTAFNSFIEQHPEQRMVPSALYWRGEAHYAKREYEPARKEFEALVARFPQSEKAADSLLKLALCFRQLGADEAARGAFRRLRTEYPKSQAALVAAREGAT